MGNLDFLEKKPRIAYTLSWDGITEGKVTNTKGSRTVYKISSEEFIPRPDIVWTPTGSTGLPCSTPKNIRLERNYRFPNIEGESNVSVSVLKEDTSKAGYYRFFLETGDNDTGNDGVDLFYVIVANKEIISAEFGNINPTFPETGWYIGSTSNEAGDIMSILKDPLVQFSYSGKGFASPQKPYRYASRSFDSDDVISIFYDPNIIPDTDEAKSKGFNAICAPGDWNTKADIKLNKDLADILKAGHIGCLNVYIHNDMPFVVEDTPVVYRPFISISYENINSIGGLCIREIDNGNITVIYFNPSISLEEFNMWANKYFLSEP